MTPEFPFFAVAPPGLEPLVAAELKALGCAGPAAEEGGVTFRAPLLEGLRVNLLSRLATRVLLRLGAFPAKTPRDLQAGLAALPWHLVVGAGTPLDVRVTSHRSRLRGPRLAPGAAAAVLALRDRLPPSSEAGAAGERAPAAPQRIQLRLVDDGCVVSVDCSGERLDRRGYRLETAAAPLRETLAAAVLGVAGWTPDLPLVDPLCGVGTIAIEAALQSLGVPPGDGRAFAFTAWPAFDPAAWDAVLAATAAARRTAPRAAIVASDVDPKAVAAARANAARAGVEHAIDFSVRPFASVVRPPGPPGLVVADPPYGHRLGTRGGLKPLYRQLGGVLASRFQGWRAAILCPDRRLERELRLLVVGRHSLPHGGRRVDLILAAL